MSLHLKTKTYVGVQTSRLTSGTSKIYRYTRIAWHTRYQYARITRIAWYARFARIPWYTRFI